MRERKNIFLVKSKKQMFTIIGVFALLLIVGGTSYAFFNYTRTGGANTLSTGRIYFNSTENGNINLTNAFPVMSDEVSTTQDKDSVIINVVGDTEYSEGVEYLISASEVTNTVNSKKVPFGITVDVAANSEVQGAVIGTSDDNYFTNRGGSTAIYKVLANSSFDDDTMLMVGYIPEGATGVNGNITITVYIDGESMAISDTYDGTGNGNMVTTSEWVDDRVVFTTSEWNSLSTEGISFKVLVEANEGIWVKDPLGAYADLKKNATLDTTIDFGQISPVSASNLNGQGKQILKGTENDPYPIVYYRGEVNNNNVVFADFCWQIIRTSDTGGIKMIYDGVATKTGDDYSCNGTAATKGINGATGSSSISLTAATVFGKTFSYDLNAGTFTLEDIVQENNVNVTWSTANQHKLVGTYTCNSSATTCSTLYYVGFYVSNTNASVESFSIGTLDHYSIIGKSTFNTYSGAMSLEGYAYNEIYKYTERAATSGAYFGTDIEYGDFDSNGTSEYRLVSGTTSTTKDDNHHYTCNLTTADGTCSNIRYYYYDNYYLTLSNGETVEDAIYKMVDHGNQETKTKNASYVLNKTDSAAKQMLEIWFKNNLTNEVGNNKPNYTNYLEDTVFCNDRGVENTLASSGWDKSGGSITGYLFFDGWYRSRNMSTVNVPKMTCNNVTDSFSVGNNKAKLKYPVGLLTVDEIILAGGKAGSGNSIYYLNTGVDYWSLSSLGFYRGIDTIFSVGYTGSIGTMYVHEAHGLRPVVSLKLGTEFIDGGDGTANNPYVVKMN